MEREKEGTDGEAIMLVKEKRRRRILRSKRKKRKKRNERKKRLCDAGRSAWSSQGRWWRQPGLVVRVLVEVAVKAVTPAVVVVGETLRR
jgi:hypothetical protein